MTASCPVCNKECCTQNVKKCEKCGFSDRLGIAVPWLELAEAEDWMDTVVLPYRRYWELNEEFSTKLEGLEEKVVRFITENAEATDRKLLEIQEAHKHELNALKEKISASAIEKKLEPQHIAPREKEKSQYENMVLIPGGSFVMGSPTTELERGDDEGPQHEVTISPFYMGIHPVTQAEYVKIMGTNPSEFKGQDLPVEMVSWYDAVEYCNRISQKEGLTPAYTINGENVSWNRSTTGYRLPTEAEWEYACRAGTTTPFSTGDNITTEQVNYDGNYPYNNNQKGSYRKKTTAVGSFQANPWGLYDMHGNVWEWCWDWYGNYSSAAQADPEGASSRTNRVLRGGSWLNNAQDLRSAYRNRNIPSNRNSLLGFRLARS